ncbi:MAG: MinD/ParA family protein [Geminicoccaceae bacterium]|nr:MAG: MinD/ParA family protein [Geminicoccaceae bacterium]
MSHIVTIASGKGGVGKTWLAASLAQAAAEQGQRVLLVDADWGLANADVQLGVTGAPCLPVHGRAEDLLAAVHPVAGFHLLAGASGSGRLADLAPATLERLAAELQRAARRYDVVLVDLASGADRSIRRWWQLGAERFLVMTPDPTSLTDAYAFLKLCCRDGDAAGARLIVNRAPSRPIGEATAERLARAAAGFLHLAVETAAILLEDPRVPSAIRAQQPFMQHYPTSPMAANLRALSTPRGSPRSDDARA